MINLSIYFPNVVPDASHSYSLRTEISHADFDPADRGTAVEWSACGGVHTGLRADTDREADRPRHARMATCILR